MRTAKGDMVWRRVLLSALVGLVLWPCVTAAAPIWDPQDLPAAVRVVLGEAGGLMDKGKVDEAVEKLLAFEARGRSTEGGDGTPHAVYSHPMIHFALGNAYLLQAAHGRARQAFEQAVGLHPDWVPAWLNLAKTHYELDAPAEAARCFFMAYEKGEEKDAEHLYLSAASHLMARQYDAAVARFDQLLARHPEQMRPEWREHLVHALLSNDQPRRALFHIRRLAGIYDGDKRIQWQEILLHQYMQLEMHADALALARDLVDEAPTLAKWWKAKAHLHLNTQDHAPALVAMIVYSYLTDLTREEQQLLADLHLQVGIPDRAAPLYESLLQAGAADKRVVRHLVTALRRIDRADAALARLESHPASGEDPDLLMLRADLLYEMERYAEAAGAYRRAAARNSRQAGQAWLMAGYAAWRTEDWAASRQAFERAARFERQRKPALTAMRRLQNQQSRAN
ncbi:tetratricopeptide repeat protein [Desulfatitalea alkaliphila]|uniref:Tetratricopeptide repeat protein n=1 Tax=Desulfatitalea alkaliphila TaxID=2929485 RepID=A0AA41QZN1_9BACT|nr:tetratricopeptide repeat protein [Desulfatitalea alkaliphila]MCJ8499327.1 tetratricopeptide repeat protein [Desulfatitalea alkaliphila]